MPFNEREFNLVVKFILFSLERQNFNQSNNSKASAIVIILPMQLGFSTLDQSGPRK